MRIDKSWLLPVLAILTLISSSGQVEGQGYHLPPQGGYGPAAGQPESGYSAWAAQLESERRRFAAHAQGQGMPPASYRPPGAPPAGPMSGPVPGGMPIGAMGMGSGSYYGGPQMGGGGGPACPHCGGGGCPACGSHRGSVNDDFDLKLLGKLLPYAGGGICAPRWLDFHLEGVYMSREDVSRGPINFTSQNPLGPIVLDSDDLDFTEEGGFRFTAWMQFGPGGGLEFQYLGQLNFRDIATVTDNAGNLMSAFSDFGAINTPNGFADTDRSNTQQIAYSSAMDGVELNWRRFWQGANCRVQGSWMAGARYMLVQESFTYKTSGATGAMNYEVGSSNSMMGGQLGTDIWITIIPGLRIGGEFKSGIFGNAAGTDTVINASSFTSPVREQLGDDSFSYIGEANAMFTWQITQNVAFRGGYSLIYVDGVALAIENFNDGPPFVANQRELFLNHNGSIFVHGFSAGAEYRW